MKKIISAIFSFLAVAVLIIWGLGHLSDITERKKSKNKFSDFYRQEEEYDVLFLGSSHVLNGVFPMELWRDYGIVSYNLSGHGSRAAVNYWILKNALEYTTPKLVVVDCYMLGLKEKVGTIDQLHMSVDHIPFSKIKVAAIQDLVEDKEEQKDFLWKFSIYHNRWSDLDTQDFTMEYSPEKGAESRIAVAATEEVEAYDGSGKLEETIAMEYLRKTIELCQEQGIEVLLTYIPFPGNRGWQPENNSAADIAMEYGINYLDFYTLLGTLNLNTDFYDKNAHMNPSGARKITEFLGEYIVSVYGIKDQRGNEDYSAWHEDYKTYTEFKHDNIRNEQELKNYLMLLRDKNLSYGVYLKWGLNLNQYPVINELLLNIGINPAQYPEEGMCFAFVDNVNGTGSKITILENMDTYFGNFSLMYNEDGHLELISKEDNRMVITWSDIGVVVFDNETLSMVDQVAFTFEDANVVIERD